MFQTHVSNVSSFVFRRMLQMFHLDVSKVDQSIAHVAMAPMAGGQRSAIGLRLLPRAFLVRRASPSPLLSLPSFPFPSLHLATARRGTLPDEAMSARTSAEVVARADGCAMPRGDPGSAPSAPCMREAEQPRAFGRGHSVRTCER
jgi:hypothetical protein